MSTTTRIPMPGATAAPRSAARPVASRGIIATLAVIVLVCLLAATVVLLAATATPAGSNVRKAAHSRHTAAVTGGRTIAAQGVVAAAALGWRGLGPAAGCGLALLGALALATAVPTPSGGSRRAADVARLTRLGADTARLGADTARPGAEPTRRTAPGTRPRTETVSPERSGPSIWPTERRAA